ncbi:Metal-dependent hydrolases of the beta-lactamase superfamily I; PhnP protein [hydrothermal vent metagenome]|uniref:Metal-dependent hydrolases of the beta-lactamase superfamily I PhnP protein n=1 Tax=hydrothermal vent metagenome TaxID=652676 RepID=A0A3B0TPD1_9ZZZZ
MSKPAQTIIATILGCGSSGGVPRIGNQWGECDRTESRNRRSRCSLLLTGKRKDSTGITQVLIDTGCDLREQLLANNVEHMDAVFYTHEHADHTHGIDDLRVMALTARKRIDVYFSARAGRRIMNSFDYCFTTAKDSGYPPILRANEIETGVPIVIKGAGGSIDLKPVLQDHGKITTFGFKIKNFLYSCDVSGFPQSSYVDLERLDVWIVDALRRSAHPSHLNLEQALDWIERVKPKQAILTNLHIDLDYKSISNETPDNVSAAYDGMKIDVIAGKILD